MSGQPTREELERFRETLRRWDGGDASRIEALEAENADLREAGIRLHALLDETLSSPPGTVYTAAVEEALDRWDALVDATDAR